MCTEEIARKRFLAQICFIRNSGFAAKENGITTAAKRQRLQKGGYAYDFRQKRNTRLS